MKYSTYISAAKKISAYGQKSKAQRIISHAIDMEKREIDKIKFNILVGSVKLFKDAKFVETRILKEKESDTLLFIFESNDGKNSHILNTRLEDDGSVRWFDGNLLGDRHSVKNLNSLIKHIRNYQEDFIKLLEDKNLKNRELKVIERTFYI